MLITSTYSPKLSNAYASCPPLPKMYLQSDGAHNNSAKTHDLRHEIKPSLVPSLYTAHANNGILFKHMFQQHCTVQQCLTHGNTQTSPIIAIKPHHNVCC